jgi:hypothetical protein
MFLLLPLMAGFMTLLGVCTILLAGLYSAERLLGG